MWIVFYNDDDAEIILDVVSSYENLLNYLRLFQEECPCLRQIGPIPNLSEEGKLIRVLESTDAVVSIVRMLPRNAPSFNRNAFVFD
jgi:hypothetical protein